MTELELDGQSIGIIRAKKFVSTSRIWLTEQRDGSWWVIVEGPDRKLRTAGFVRPSQEQRAREVYEALSLPNVIGSFLEGVDS